MVELSHVLGCGPGGSESYGDCQRAGESVTVMEELDHFPDPAVPEHATGRVDEFNRIADAWVAPDVEGVPRDRSYPIPVAWIAEGDRLLLLKTLGKTWENPPPDVISWTGGRSDVGVVRLGQFPTWDNRVTSAGTRNPVVTGEDCR